MALIARRQLVAALHSHCTPTMNPLGLLIGVFKKYGDQTDDAGIPEVVVVLHDLSADGYRPETYVARQLLASGSWLPR